MRVRILSFVVCIGCIVAGCDGATDDVPALQGRYAGTFTYIAEPGPFFPGGEVMEPWELTLMEAGSGTVTGSGILNTTRVSVVGTHAHPEVMLEFTDDQGDFAGQFTGTLSDDGRALEGIYTFNFFFVNQPITLQLQ